MRAATTCRPAGPRNLRARVVRGEAFAVGYADRFLRLRTDHGVPICRDDLPHVAHSMSAGTRIEVTDAAGAPICHLGDGGTLAAAIIAALDRRAMEATRGK